MGTPASLLEAWTHTCRREPAASLLIDATSGRTWTRAEIDAAADEWCAESGAAARGQVVAFAEPNGMEWLMLFLGLIKCGAVIAPLDPGEPFNAQLATAGAIRATWLWRQRTLQRVSDGSRKSKTDGRRLIKLTSGSTGAPRPLIFTDAELIADGQQLCAAMRIRADDLNLGLIPWGHSYGLGNLIVPLIVQGTAIVYGAPPLPHAIGSAIEQWKATLFPAVPAHLRALAESTVTREQLASLRTVISAGAPLGTDVAQAFERKFGRSVHSFYGSSETGGISYDESGKSAALASGVGHPLPGVDLEFGRDGRVTVTSNAVFSIGNRHPHRHRMSDIARLGEQGELVLLGRAGRFVKIAGRRLNLAEIEHALKRISGVRDALVAPHAERPDALAAAVVSELSGNEIRGALRDKLAAWKIPKKILTLQAFPLTSRGKTDTRQVRALLGSSPSTPANT